MYSDVVEATVAIDATCAERLVDDEQVALVRSQLPTSVVVEALANDIFSVLADPSRLRLLIALRIADELCVCDVAAAAGMSQSATSHALRLMRASGVVRARRDGRMIRYSLVDGHVSSLLDIALEHVGHGHE